MSGLELSSPWDIIRHRKEGTIIYKLLVIDIDGTLITTDMQITNATRQAIEDAQSQGVVVTLATGRCYHSALNYAHKLKIDSPLICANGGIIVSRAGKILQESTLPAPVAVSLLDKMRRNDLIVQAYHREGVYTAGPRPSRFQYVNMICGNMFSPSHLLYSLREYKRCAVTHNNDLPRLIDQGQVAVHKLFCAGSREKQDYIQAQAVEAGLMADYYLGYRGLMFLELMADQVSKGNALRVLARYLGFSLKETVAVGDNLNDLSMINVAGLGVAMGNGRSQLKQAADYTTLSNDEDGIAALIYEKILGEDMSQQVI